MKHKKQRVLQFFLILQNSPPSKVSRSTFYNISFSINAISLKSVLVLKTKIYLHWDKNFFNGKPKMTKKLNLKNWKSPKMATCQDLGFSTFQIQIVLSFLVFNQKKICFSKQIYFCLTKKVLRLIASIEKKIYYKR